MKHARIISGEYADNFSKEAQDNVVDAEGNVNWRAAMWADPGVKSCPKCKAHYWNEAAVMECPVCLIQFGNGVALDVSGNVADICPDCHTAHPMGTSCPPVTRTKAL